MPGYRDRAAISVLVPCPKPYKDRDVGQPKNRNPTSRQLMSALPLKRPYSGRWCTSQQCATELMHRSKILAYSITSSAVASSVWGIVRPSALAVLRLITSSNLVGCSIGRSAGLAPFMILST
jgi:hypothetical protein